MKRFLQALLLWAMGAANAFADGTININTGEGTGTGWTYSNPTVTITANGTYTISGSTTTNRVKVNSNINATITLSGVNINVSSTDGACAFDVSDATVTVKLAGTNTLKSGKERAGLQSSSGTLTITSADGDGATTGTLNATGGKEGAGIGSQQSNAGAVIINGGTINATGTGAVAAGIGGGREGGNATVTINGGHVTGTGVEDGAGIGGGGGGNTSAAGTGTVTINGGTVTGTCTGSGAGIGGGGNIGTYSKGNGGVGTVTINGGTVTGTCTGVGGAGIGGGGCSWSNESVGGAGNVTINGGIVTASAARGKGAGIGGGGYSVDGGSHYGAGGAGTVTITGGVVVAYSYSYGAGIGSGGTRGWYSGRHTIAITGGTVIAYNAGETPGNGSRVVGVGIGQSGYEAGGDVSSGTVSISNTSVIFANTASNISSDPTKGIAIGNIISWSNKTITLNNNFTVPAGAKLTIPPGWTLSCNSKTLTNNGEIVNSGTLNGSGTLINNSTFTNNGAIGNDLVIISYGTVSGSKAPTLYPLSFTLIRAGAASSSTTISATYAGVSLTPNVDVSVSQGKALAVTANGADSYTYAWTVNNAPSGVTSSVLTLNNISAAQNVACIINGILPENGKLVTFDTQGGGYAVLNGGYVASVCVTANDAIDSLLPQSTAKPGYVFAGWYTAAKGGAQVTASTVITGDTTFFAQWIGISLNHAGTHSFGSLTYGYAAAPEAESITVTNEGPQATGAITVALSGENGAAFELNPSSPLTSIAAYDSSTFTVQPKAGLSVGTYTATVTVTIAGNSDVIRQFSVNFTVTPKATTVAVDAIVNQTYTGSEIKPEPVVKDNDKTLTEGADFEYSYSHNVSVGDTAKVTVTGKGNYAGSTGSRTFTIKPKEISVTVAAITQKPYDGADSAAVSSVFFGGVASGEQLERGVDYTVAAAFADGASVGTGKPVVVTVALLGTPKANSYTLTNGENFPATGSITKKRLTIADASIASKTYDGTTAATLTGVTFDGLVGSDSLTLNEDYTATATFNTATAGGGKTVTVSVALPSEGPAGSYSLIAPYSLAGQSIAKKEISITYASIDSKTYDGDTTAKVAGVAFGGLENGESLALNVGYTATAAFADSSAGTGKLATVRVTLQGVAAGNYALTNSPYPLAGQSIAKREISIIAVSIKSKGYDGTTTATVNTVSFFGLVSGESFTKGTHYTAAAMFADASVGTGKPVNVNVALQGAAATNYVLANGANYPATGNITQEATTVPITITSAAIKSKTYDGTTTATVMGVTFGGLGNNGESLALDTDYTATAAFTTAAAGDNKPATVTVTLIGTAAASYSLTNGTSNLATGSIAKDTITITGATIEDKTYNGKTAATVTSVTFDGLENGETLDLSTGYTATAAFADAAAGDNKPVTVTVTLRGTAAGNYVLAIDTVSTTGSIAKKEISITSVFIKSKSYDGTDTATVSSVTFGGLVSGESLAKGTDYTATAFTDDANVGTGKQVAVTVTLLNTTKANSYLLTNGELFPATGSITKATITITGASIEDKTYDGTTAATVTAVTFGGLKNDESLALNDDYTVTAATFNTAAAGDGKTVAVRVALQGNAATSYALQKATYSLAGQSIARKPISITGASIESKTYDGDTTAGVTGVAFGGLENGESLVLGTDYTAAAAFADATAGTGKPATVRVTLLGTARAKSYTLNGDTSYAATGGSITKATITIDSASIEDKTYDGTTAATVTGVTFGGLVSGESFVKGTGYTATASFADAAAGTGKTATIRVTLLNNAAANYDLQRATYSLTGQSIAKKEISITGAAVESKTYDGTTAATVTAVTFAGLASGEALTRGADYAVDSARFTDANAGNGNKTATLHLSLKEGSPAANNYALSSAPYAVENLTISPAPQRIAMLFPAADTTICHNDRPYTLMAASLTDAAPPLPVRFALEPREATVATLSDSVLTPYHKGTVTVKAYVEHNPNYEDADTAQRTITIEWGTYTLTFNANGGLPAPPDTVVEHGSKISVPVPAPTKAGYTFGGWYTDTAGVYFWDFDEEEIFKSRTFYARWTADVWKIEKIAINGEEQEVSGDSTISYAVPCGANVQEVKIEIDYFSGLPSDTLIVPASRPFKLDTVLQNGYRLRLEKKMFDFESIVVVQLGGKLLTVINTPQNNGGFHFREVRWWRMVGGNRDWMLSNKFYYAPSGGIITDSIVLQLQDSTGAWLESCPYSYAPPAAPDAPRMAVYPNPVSSGKTVHLKEELLIDETLEERYATLSLIDVQGKVVRAGKASDLRQGFAMPLHPGIYHLVLEGKAGRKVLKVVVK